MDTKEMINYLQKYKEYKGDLALFSKPHQLPDDLIAAIIKTLQDYEELKMRLKDVKFPVLGNIR